MIFCSWVIVLSPFPVPEGPVAVPVRGENRARPRHPLRKPTTIVRLSSSYRIARNHAAERVPDDQRFFDLQSSQQLVVAEDQIPEAVEPVNIVVRLRRRPRMLGRINREAPRQIVEKRIPREPPRAVEKDQRRPCT